VTRSALLDPRYSICALGKLDGMGREERREILTGSRPEPVPEIDLERASGSPEAEAAAPQVPPPDGPGRSDDEPFSSAYEAGNPDAVPADVTESPRYQEALDTVRTEVKNEQAVLRDGRRDMPPTNYENRADT
jgi:hypothetical protein